MHWAGMGSYFTKTRNGWGWALGVGRPWACLRLFQTRARKGCRVNWGLGLDWAGVGSEIAGVGGAEGSEACILH